MRPKIVTFVSGRSVIGSIDPDPARHRHGMDRRHADAGDIVSVDDEGRG